MSGFFGDLSADQQEALAKMKNTVDVDDHTLLRFLRARQFNVEKALEMYNKYVQYRKTSGIEQILHSELPKTDLFKRLIPHSFHGFDVDGRPVYIEKTGQIDYPTVYRYMSNEELMIHHCWQMEHQIDRCKESSKALGKNIESVCNLVDLKNLNMGHRKAVSFIKLCAAHDQAYHPERMGRTIIVNAPWVFPFFWKLCSVFLDENTKKKIIVLGSDYKKKLPKFIPAHHLPEEYGGTCKCDGKHCVPVPDIADLKSIDPNELLAGVDAVTHTIARKDVFEVKLECGDQGGVFEWAWKSSSKDIMFSVRASCLPDDGAAAKPHAKDSKDSSPEASVHEPYVVVEPERAQYHKGTFTAESKCTVTLLFDNSFSRFTSKQIQYHTSVSPLSEASLSRANTHSRLDLHGDEKAPAISRQNSLDRLTLPLRVPSNPPSGNHSPVESPALVRAQSGHSKDDLSHRSAVAASSATPSSTPPNPDALLAAS